MMLLYLGNILCSAGQSALSKLFAGKGGGASAFNRSKALAAVALFLFFGLFSPLRFHLPTVLWASGYGLCLAVSMHTGFMALSTGPMALTSILAALSLVIPTVWGLVFWKEPLSGWGAAGLALMLICIVLLNFRKEYGISKKWSVYALATFAANGFCSVIQKYHQRLYPRQYRIEFMLTAMLLVLLLLLAGELARKRPLKGRCSGFGLAAGVMNAAANYIVLYLSAAENASVLFPVVSVGNVVAAWLVSKLFFREKMKKIQLLGLLLGIAAVVLLKL